MSRRGERAKRENEQKRRESKRENKSERGKGGRERKRTIIRERER